jgi:hypothetical protein
MNTILFFSLPPGSILLWVASVFAIGFALFVADLCLSFVNFVRSTDDGVSYGYKQFESDEKENASKQSIIMFIGLMLCAWPVFLNTLFVGDEFNFLGIGIVLSGVLAVFIAPRLFYVMQALIWFPIWWNDGRRSAEDASYPVFSPGMLLLLPLIVFGRIEDFSGLHGPDSYFCATLVSLIILGFVFHWKFYSPIRDRNTRWKNVIKIPRLTRPRATAGTLFTLFLVCILGTQSVFGATILDPEPTEPISTVNQVVPILIIVLAVISLGLFLFCRNMCSRKKSKISMILILVGSFMPLAMDAHSGMDRFTVAAEQVNHSSEVAVYTVLGVLQLIAGFLALFGMIALIVIPWFMGMQTLWSNMSKVRKQATIILLLVGLFTVPSSADAVNVYYEAPVVYEAVQASWQDILFLLMICFACMYALMQDAPKDPKPGTSWWRILNS